MQYRDLKLGSNDSTYFKIVDGQNKVRIVSEAIPVWTEFNRDEKTATKYLTEDLAKDHPEAKKRHALWVIDRVDGKIKLAEFGYTIMKQIQNLAMDVDYGFEGATMPYDLKILRTGQSMDTEYAVTPSPKSDLTEDEKQKVAGLEDVTSFMSKQPGVHSNDLSLPPF